VFDQNLAESMYYHVGFSMFRKDIFQSPIPRAKIEKLFPINSYIYSRFLKGQLKGRRLGDQLAMGFSTEDIYLRACSLS
jgi:hypothetical protein